MPAPFPAPPGFLLARRRCHSYSPTGTGHGGPHPGLGHRHRRPPWGTPLNEPELRALFAYDRFAAAAGIELVEVREGYAMARMRAEGRHLNGVDVVQGGCLFTLADFAFAAACNSHGTLAVAINASISFVEAGRPGLLTAEAQELAVSPRLSACTVHVRDSSGTLIAIFQGMAYRKHQSVADYLEQTKRS